MKDSGLDVLYLDFEFYGSLRESSLKVLDLVHGSPTAREIAMYLCLWLGGDLLFLLQFPTNLIEYIFLPMK